MQKYDLAVLNRGEHVHCPLNDEKLVHFWGDFFNEKKKKIKYSSPPSENWPKVFTNNSKYIHPVPKHIHLDQFPHPGLFTSSGKSLPGSIVYPFNSMYLSRYGFQHEQTSINWRESRRIECHVFALQPSQRGRRDQQSQGNMKNESTTTNEGLGFEQWTTTIRKQFSEMICLFVVGENLHFKALQPRI